MHYLHAYCVLLPCLLLECCCFFFRVNDRNARILCHCEIFSYRKGFPIVDFYMCVCMCVGVERHLGVISLLVRGLHLRQLEEDSL